MPLFETLKTYIFHNSDPLVIFHTTDGICTVLIARTSRNTTSIIFKTSRYCKVKMHTSHRKIVGRRTPETRYPAKS